MPQTSLLSFLGSSGNGNSGSLSKPKHNTLLGRVQPEVRSDGVVAGTKSIVEEPLKSSKASILTQINNQNGTSLPLNGVGNENDNTAGSDAYEVKDEDNTAVEDTPIQPPNTSPFPPTEPTFTLPDFPSITITTIQPAHLPALKRLTATLLPIKYPDAFYSESISCCTASALSRVALYTPSSSSSSSTTTSTPTPKPIGWIRCSLHPDPNPTSPPHNAIYIKALCLLAPYRHMGIATALLDCILHQPDLLRTHNVHSIFAHVWECNEEALEWYAARGFARDEGGVVAGYYRRLKPGGAWVVRRKIYDHGWIGSGELELGGEELMADT